MVSYSVRFFHRITRCQILVDLDDFYIQLSSLESVTPAELQERLVFVMEIFAKLGLSINGNSVLILARDLEWLGHMFFFTVHRVLAPLPSSSNFAPLPSVCPIRG